MSIGIRPKPESRLMHMKSQPVVLLMHMKNRPTNEEPTKAVEPELTTNWRRYPMRQRKAPCLFSIQRTGIVDWRRGVENLWGSYDKYSQQRVAQCHMKWNPCMRATHMNRLSCRKERRNFGTSGYTSWNREKAEIHPGTKPVLWWRVFNRRRVWILMKYLPR